MLFILFVFTAVTALAYLVHKTMPYSQVRVWQRKPVQTLATRQWGRYQPVRARADVVADPTHNSEDGGIFGEPAVITHAGRYQPRRTHEFAYVDDPRAASIGKKAWTLALVGPIALLACAVHPVFGLALLVVFGAGLVIAPYAALLAVYSVFRGRWLSSAKLLLLAVFCAFGTGIVSAAVMLLMYW